MKLNCKKDDLAIVVQSSLGNLGRVVRCVRAGVAGESVKCTDGIIRGTDLYSQTPFWIVDQLMAREMGNGVIVGAPIFPDFALRPLRDSDEPDETLTWAGKPQEVKA